MNIEQLLRDDEPAILDEALPAIRTIGHYAGAGEDATRRRVEALYRHVARAVSALDLDDLVAHARRVARERFEQGFDLAEVQAAFAMMEDAIRRRAVARLPMDELAWGLALVGTALAHGRDALGRTFLDLVVRAGAPSVDLTPLFKRSERGAPQRAADEWVYPV